MISRQEYSISGPGKTGQLYVKQWTYNIFFIYKNKLKRITDLNARPDTMQFLKGNISRTFSDINC